MTYVLLMLFPLAMAGGTFALRRDHLLTAWAAIAAFAIMLVLALTAPVDQAAVLFEIAVNYSALGRLFLTTFCVGGLLAALTAWTEPPGEYFLPSLLLILAITTALLIVQEPFVVAVLLLLASLIGALQLVDQPQGATTLLRPQTIGTALKYTLLMALGGVLLLIGFVLATAYGRQLAGSGQTLSRGVFGLLLIGFGIRAGLIPFHVWLPDALEEGPPTTGFVHAGWLTILALPVLLVALQTQPELLAGNASGRRLLIGLGSLSAIGGGVLALTAERPRRSLACLLIANLGLLTIALGIGTVGSVSAALLGAVNHLVGVALLMLGLTLLEQQVPGRREQAGALRERPLAALAFLIGLLVLVGVPPLSGFVPKLMLIAATRGEGWFVGLLVAGGLVVSAVAAARLLRRVLLHPRDVSAARTLFSDDLDRLAVNSVPYAPRLLLTTIVLLAIAIVAAGVWPQPLVAQVDELVRSLSFLRQ